MQPSAMANPSADRALQDTRNEATVPNKKTHSSFYEDDLPKPRINKHYKNRLSTASDYISSPLATSSSAVKKQHTRANSTSFEEYQHGTTRKNCRHWTTAAGYTSHARVHSWSESNNSTASSNITTATACGTRTGTSHNSNRNSSVLISVHNEFQSLGNNQEAPPPHGKPYVKVKTKIKTNRRFHRIVLAQTLVVDTSEIYATNGVKVEDKGTEDPKQPMGAIWTTRFSKDGKYMATGGQSCAINVWKTLRDPERTDNIDVQDLMPHEPSIKVFHDAPVRTFVGHKADVLDLSWSKNNFLISSSMDKTVRLWHVSQKVCLCVFRHLDVVTSVKFHPKDDRFFLSGSFDCKVRLWSIPEKRVAFWNEIPAGNMVTAVGFTLDGRTACVGANTGDVFFFDTQGLKYNTQILVKNHHHKRGKKVTGIEPMPGMPPGEERILVTTNDSRIWIINMKDKSLVYKYKGIENTAMQIKASFSDDGRYIICGSEDGCVYLWCTDQVNYSPFQHWYASRIKAAAALGHLGDHMLQPVMQNGVFSDESYGGGIRGWLKRGERRMIDKLRSRNEHFTAHQHVVSSAIFAPTKTRQLLAKAGGDIIFDNTPVYTNREPFDYDADINDDDYNYNDNNYGSSSSSGVGSGGRHSSSRYSSSSSSSSLIYQDVMSERRRSQASLSQFTHQQDLDLSDQEESMDTLRRLLIKEFEEASQEEREKFDYPDSQIIVSADLHGAIKVWRMDSGYYRDNEPAGQTIEIGEQDSMSAVNDNDTLATLISPYHHHKPESLHKTMETNKTPSPLKKGPIASLLSKFK